MIFKNSFSTVWQYIFFELWTWQPLVWKHLKRSPVKNLSMKNDTIHENFWIFAIETIAQQSHSIRFVGDASSRLASFRVECATASNARGVTSSALHHTHAVTASKIHLNGLLFRRTRGNLLHRPWLHPKSAWIWLF